MPKVEAIASAKEFVRLRSSEKPDEYQRAAWGQASDAVWLTVLEQYPEYAKWVAHNKTISLEIIMVLAAHPDDSVRSLIAAKRKTPPEVLWNLARDPSESVRERVVYNAKTPVAILEFLLNDPVDRVRQKARQRLSEQQR